MVALNDEQKMREELLIRLYIDEILDDALIRGIQDLVRETDLHNNRRMGRAQFSGLQGVARDTTSVQVILNWLRYQIGRQVAWRDGGFGPRLLDILGEQLRGQAQSIANEIVDKIGSVNYEERDYNRLVRRVWLALIRQYVGQLQRAVLGYQGA